ncbi:MULTISPECIES: glycosyltransferase family 4 protein [Rhodopseudomonas]|uniref:Glycosyl transferase n=1 Tax=Rhodopseudomonas palustris TaxID=1076 RepID=A0A0D7ELL4_RHOPL|nr:MULTISPECIES: glycosyltransferase family 4 protein [Rhodopseudomonas]KIZ41556.1 glycosyl transferase [Rhodopseudomonas palustris]MDF3812780.1 glycosyltransferase family 4 protein [Rhodopseudomonas sp. BAL398]WOK20333.1 glycosyltransferase family 4 protein [Rhodopseudomonas sp. BAL398]
MTAPDYIASLITIALAAILCAVATWALMPLLARYALARPNARSSHRSPTPQGAGIAVILSTLTVAGGVIAVTSPVAAGLPTMLFVATVVIALVGAVDDIRPIPVMPRLALQALAVGAVLLTIPGELRLLPVAPLWIERGVLFLAGLWFVNLVNFMDGLDWMTVAEIAPVTGALVVLGLFGALPPAATIVAAALCGAMLAFAPFNRPVAKVFLGDVGSLPIGLLVGWCLLELALRQNFAAALLLPLYYLADASLTLLRRLKNREAVWLAHRSHFYQRATDNGFSVRQVAGRVLTTNLVLAILAGLSVMLGSGLADLILLGCGAATVAILLVQFATPRR